MSRTIPLSDAQLGTPADSGQLGASAKSAVAILLLRPEPKSAFARCLLISSKIRVQLFIPTHPNPLLSSIETLEVGDAAVARPVLWTGWAGHPEYAAALGFRKAGFVHGLWG